MELYVVVIVVVNTKLSKECHKDTLFYETYMSIFLVLLNLN